MATQILFHSSWLALISVSTWLCLRTGGSSFCCSLCKEKFCDTGSGMAVGIWQKNALSRGHSVSLSSGVSFSLGSKCFSGPTAGARWLELRTLTPRIVFLLQHPDSSVFLTFTFSLSVFFLSLFPAYGYSKFLVESDAMTDKLRYVGAGKFCRSRGFTFPN